jgi:hypothetical protein
MGAEMGMVVSDRVEGRKGSERMTSGRKWGSRLLAGVVLAAVAFILIEIWFGLTQAR